MLFHLFNYIFLKLFPFIVFFNLLPFIVLISSCLSSNTCISTWLNDNKITCGICEKSVANDHQVIHCHKCGIWIHIKCNKINKQTYIYLICENSHWYCMLCTKTFLSYSVLNNNEIKQTIIGKQVKFTPTRKRTISNAQNFIKAINSENNITKYFCWRSLFLLK